MSKEPAQEPARITIRWDFEICRLCGATDAAHNLIPENFDHEFMGELKRADLKEPAWSGYD